MSALRFVRATITLYLSKSVRFLRAACLAASYPTRTPPTSSTSAALSAAANASLEGVLLQVNHQGGDREAAGGIRTAGCGRVDENLR